MTIPQLNTTEKYLTASAVQEILLDAWKDAQDTAVADEVSMMIQSTLTRTLYLAAEIADLLDRIVLAVLDKNESVPA
ncbi:MAG TPA: hypothetical protein VHD87_15645 [Acidimicrobiales bacterium]|nr:hypothetical protein [Acidimicrobiales bacterium]